MSANTPDQILEVLTGEAHSPLGFPTEQVDKARALLNADAAAKTEELESLPEPLALAVLEGSVRRSSVVVADALASSKHKPLAKAAKKALYRLRSSGVAVPEKKGAIPAQPSTAPVALLEEIPPSLVSGITGTGERALIIGRPVRARVETVQIVIADESGVVHLGLNEISRGQYRKLLKDAHRPGAPASVELPLEDAKTLLAEAVGTNLRTHTPFPDGLERVLRHLELKPWDHPFEVPPPEDGDQALAARGAELHQQPEISQWLPPVEDLRRFAQKAQEIATSKLLVDETQRAQQLRHVVESASEEFQTPAIRQLYGRRLWRMADFFDRTGRPEPAAIARAEARRMFHSAPGMLSPFVVRLFEKVLALQ